MFVSTILGPAAKWRALIVPAGSTGVSATMLDPTCAPERAVSTDSLAFEAAVAPDLRHSRRSSWQPSTRRTPLVLLTYRPRKLDDVSETMAAVLFGK